MFNLENKVCCFIGHRKIDKTPKLRENLLNIIEDLIVNKNGNIMVAIFVGPSWDNAPEEFIEVKNDGTRIIFDIFTRNRF